MIKNIFDLDFHHFGLAVKKPGKAVEFLENLCYLIGESVYDEEQNVNLIMCQHESMPEVEIIYPAKSPGPLDNWLKASSEIIYHLCYSCVDLDYSLEKLRTKHRIITIADRKPAILFDYKKVSFYKVQGFGIIEILESSTL